MDVCEIHVKLKRTSRIFTLVLFKVLGAPKTYKNLIFSAPTMDAIVYPPRL